MIKYRSLRDSTMKVISHTYLTILFSVHPKLFVLYGSKMYLYAFNSLSYPIMPRESVKLFIYTYSYFYHDHWYM